MATENQLHLLSNAKQSYIDGIDSLATILSTFVHAILKSNELAKQVALLFVLMSGKKEEDYRKVFEAINMLLEPDLEVEVIMNFEAAI